eukprot:SM000184S03756  [mRNA]  locus=s184:35514:38303:+ [translate_table: standard]
MPSLPADVKYHRLQAYLFGAEKALEDGNASQVYSLSLRLLSFLECESRSHEDRVYLDPIRRRNPAEQGGFADGSKLQITAADIISLEDLKLLDEVKVLLNSDSTLADKLQVPEEAARTSTPAAQEPSGCTSRDSDTEATPGIYFRTARSKRGRPSDRTKASALRPALGGGDRAAACWWAATGLIHGLIEGAYVLSPGFHRSASRSFFIEVCGTNKPAAAVRELVVLLAWPVGKEYSKADSRYVTRDSFVVAMETVTAFLEGPASLLAVYAIVKRKPYRYTLQIIVSMGQLYGDVLYFATCYLEGFVHSDPQPVYFWGYFVAINAIWIVVPLCIILRCWRSISKVIAAAELTKQD